ncbi:hypothetical protein Hypma_001519 [Hypsizygus marmoreus]|uniref:Uncharacterized protein n=1 Tax=Hypsizygus marmoreus TaxID=39966 RepID=A0A369K2L3_HYPMA|nr:hypothetical protein Hypma_001519 [Hypsizygus marmoreus]
MQRPSHPTYTVAGLEDTRDLQADAPCQPGANTDMTIHALSDRDNDADESRTHPAPCTVPGDPPQPTSSSSSARNASPRVLISNNLKDVTMDRCKNSLAGRDMVVINTFVINVPEHIKTFPHAVGNHADTQDQLASLLAHLVSIASDINSLSTSPALSITNAAPDPSNQCLVSDLIAANNDTVPVIQDLRAQVAPVSNAVRASDVHAASLGTTIQGLPHALNTLRADAASPVTGPASDIFVRATKRGRSDDGPSSTSDILVPATKRSRSDDGPSSTLVLCTAIPQGFPQGPTFTYSLPTQHAAALPAAPFPVPPAVPLAPPPIALPAAPAPMNSMSPPGTEVHIGAMQWGRDITGQFRALMNAMVRGQHITRNVRSRRLPSPGYISVQFPTAQDAAAFIRVWSAAPSPGYESVNAILGN